MTTMPTPSRAVSRTAYGASVPASGMRHVPEEVPVAFSFHGTTHAVMMASPTDLEDFAIGFCLGDGIVTKAAEILEVDIVQVDGGVDLQITLATDQQAQLKTRRRHMAGPVGCGLCGVESIEDVLRPLPEIAAEGQSFTPRDIVDAVALLSQQQPMNQKTRAMHAAGFYIPGEGIVAVREDVGRHNALDKLAGHLARTGQAAREGAIVMTSRVSVELVQKAAIAGAPLLIAVSAPTALALDVAERAGITIAALVRGDAFELFTHPGRISAERSSHVA